MGAAGERTAARARAGGCGQFQQLERCCGPRCVVGSQTGMSRGGMTGQIEKVTRAESPGCLTAGPNVMFPPLAFWWPCCLNP